MHTCTWSHLTNESELTLTVGYMYMYILLNTNKNVRTCIALEAKRHLRTHVHQLIQPNFYHSWHHYSRFQHLESSTAQVPQVVTYTFICANSITSALYMCVPYMSVLCCRISVDTGTVNSVHTSDELMHPSLAALRGDSRDRKISWSPGSKSSLVTCTMYTTVDL